MCDATFFADAAPPEGSTAFAESLARAGFVPATVTKPSTAFTVDVLEQVSRLFGAARTSAHDAHRMLQEGWTYGLVRQQSATRCWQYTKNACAVGRIPVSRRCARRCSTHCIFIERGTPSVQRGRALALHRGPPWPCQHVPVLPGSLHHRPGHRALRRLFRHQNHPRPSTWSISAAFPWLITSARLCASFHAGTLVSGTRRTLLKRAMQFNGSMSQDGYLAQAGRRRHVARIGADSVCDGRKSSYSAKNTSSAGGVGSC